jgi:hypothetical protein
MGEWLGPLTETQRQAYLALRHRRTHTKDEALKAVGRADLLQRQHPDDRRQDDPARDEPDAE